MCQLHKGYYFLRTITLLGFLFISLATSAQEGLEVSGSVSVGGELYSVEGISNRRSPYSYQLNGRLVFSYGEFSIPVTGSYRDAQFSYDFTFNRLGIAPTYKWIRVYLGWNTMNFSPYTMSGRAFNGIGVELKPGNFVFAAMKGRIQNPLAIRDTLIDGASVIPGFDRLITGGKIGFAHNRNKVELILMRIEDDLESFELPEHYEITYGYNVLTPKENLVLGFNGGVSLFKKLDLFFNTGLSVFSADASDSLLIDYGKSAPAFLSDLFQANSTTRAALAGDGGASFRIKSTRIGVKYRRVDPFYTTLASNYFNADVEQYTFTLGSSAFKRKFRFDTQLGLESNNLTQLRTNTTHRVIGQGNLHITPKENFTTTLTYSNFQTESENRILLLNDTLRYISISSQYGLTSALSFKNDSRGMQFSFSSFYHTVRDQSEVAQIGDINILSLSLGHGYSILPIDMTISPSLHFNRYTYSDVEQVRWGGGLRLAKKLFEKKINLSLSGTYSLNTYDQLRDGDVSMIAMAASYKLTPSSTLSLNSSYRSSASLINRSFQEFRTYARFHQQF